MSSKNPQVVSVEQFRQLQRQLEKLLANQSSSECNSRKVIIEKDPPQNEKANLKPTKLPEFNGNRAEYPAWRAAVLDTFRMDWLLFGYDNSRAFLMIYNALKGVAKIKAGPFYENGGVHNARDPEDFIEFLDRLYLDSTRVSKANTELHLMKMKDGQQWSDFYASWSNKLTEARGDFWPDENKISMLQNALNKKLTTALAGNHLLPDDDFHGWIKIVNKVAQRLEAVDSRFGNWRGGDLARGNLKPTTRQREESQQNEAWNKGKSEDFGVSHRRQVGDLDDSGDTIMGGINSANITNAERRRAKWKSKAQLDKLREEGRCFRCERQGCVTRRCPLLPAIKPQNSGPRVNIAALPEIDPSVYEIDEEKHISEN